MKKFVNQEGKEINLTQEQLEELMDDLCSTNVLLSPRKITEDHYFIVEDENNTDTNP